MCLWPRQQAILCAISGDGAPICRRMPPNAMSLWRGYIEDQAGGTLETLNDTLGTIQAALPALPAR